MSERKTTAGLDPIETASVDELRNLQKKRLRETLTRVYRDQPIYRKAFDEHGVHPEDFRELADLAKFPFTTKKYFRDHYPFGLFAVPLDKVARIHASSGTTGQPTVVGYTKKDLDTWSSLVARSIYAAGGRPGDLVHVAYGYGLFTGGLGAHYGAERLGCTVIPMSGGQTQRQALLIRDFNPDIIMCTPSYMLNIADEIDRQKIDLKKLKLRCGIFGAEPWTNNMRQELERRLLIDAVDIYGLSEVLGPGVGQECVETKDGPTIWEDHFYPEIVSPETGEVLPEGERGELVFTTITKEAMPVVRYQTRDLTRLLPGSVRTMRRMEKITGRSDDMLIVRGVNMFPTQIEEQILSIPALSPHYLIEVERKGSMDQLYVRVEAQPDCERAGYTAAAGELCQQIKGFIGVSCTVEVVAPGSIPRSEGKAMRVTDRRRA